MKFSAQEEYGLRCVLHLARAASGADGGEKGAPASRTVSAVAEREGVSAQYASRLFRVLAKAGVVEGVRGCKGGYALARPPEQIAVAEVLTALGGKFYEPGLCDRYSGDSKSCVHTSDCSIRSLWSALQGAIDEVLVRTSLADLVAGDLPAEAWGEASPAVVGGGVVGQWVDGLRVPPTEEGAVSASTAAAVAEREDRSRALVEDDSTGRGPIAGARE